MIAHGLVQAGARVMISSRKVDELEQTARELSDDGTCMAVPADLSTLGPLPWWGHRDHPGAVDDLRDAFARLAPLAPIDEEALTAVQNWMDRPRASEPRVEASPAPGGGRADRTG